MTARRRSARPHANRRRAARRRTFWLIFAALVLAAFAAGFWVGRRQASPPRTAESAAGETAPRPYEEPVAPPERPAGSAPERPAEAAPRPAVPFVYAPAAGARVALVLDDLGRDVGDIAAFSSLGVPVAYGVLPFETRTAEVVAELRRRGLEILCHLPMEPTSDANPGPGALTGKMSAAELRRATRRALAAVAGASGVNNHMGSGLTADRGAMRAILGEIARERLFYLDSRTSAESVGYATALELGLPAARRDVFLDVDPAPEAIRFQFRRLLDLARDGGAAIAIGHPYPATIAVLAREVPRAVAAGYEFVPVSYLVDRPGGVG